MIKNENGVAVMSAAGILEKPTSISDVGDLFKPNGKVGNGFQSHKLKPTIPEKEANKFTKVSNAPQPASNQQMPTKQQSKEKQQNLKGAKQCAWCGDTSHKYFQCTTFGNGKWKDRVCNRCNGKGHPPETCSNPPKSKEENGKK